MIKNLIYHLKRPYHFVKTGLMAGLIWQIKTGNPQKKLKIICITGTDGKTTSSSLLFHVMKEAGFKVALVSTVAAYLKDEEIDTGFHVTSPDPKQLYKFMKRLIKNDVEYLVLETTSHGIYQYRAWGIKPLIAAVTNINHEHLDYHITYDNYLQAKAEILKKAKLAVINKDDQSFTKLNKILNNFVTFSLDMELNKKIWMSIRARFEEKYNQMNALLVTKVCQALGVSDEQIASSMASFPGVRGRLEKIDNHKNLHVFVDFAHTPQALEQVLNYAKQKLVAKDKKLIVVFGCAGLRDVQKRPLMGKIASDLADIAIFTEEDYRTENIWSIIRQMKTNVTENNHKIISVINRGEAIEFAVNLAHSGDVILICGKGHEQSLARGNKEYSWDDVAAARKALQ